MLGLVEVSVVVCAIALTASIALWWLRRSRPSFTQTDQPETTEWLFHDGVLQHATPPAQKMLSLEPGANFWQDIRAGLLARFPDFPDAPGTGQTGQTTFEASDDQGPLQAMVNWRGPLCWVSLFDKNEVSLTPSDQSYQDELRALRQMRDSAPDPAWQENKSGKICWFNQAYETLYRRVHGGTVDSKLPLFSDCNAGLADRVSLSTGVGERPDWYKLAISPVKDGVVFHATCINAVVAAEEAQRNFVQTLAKTFAHLSIGLAIFDKDGQLKIFNPALVDLTGLPAHFLSARPTMLSFFDQLRENRGMPEPKDYHTWREEIAGVIAAATDGRYQETWTLESGQTYSVKGRPHPDGATAFLIEDISAEMTLTRNFRAELEQGQLLLDMVDEPMVVFSPTGVLTFSNAAYRDMWGVDPDASFADVLIRDSIAVWKEKCGPSSVWKSVEGFVAEFGERQMWDVTLGYVHGALLHCHLVPLPSGATLVKFIQRDQQRPDRVKEMRLSSG